jgi:class 3 adenylate cyclase
VLFTDIVQSTERANELGDTRWRALLDHHDQLVTAEVARFRGRWVKSTGDGVLATFDGPGRALECARAIRSAVAGAGLQIRAGLHTGEVDRRGDDVSGVAVHLAARVLACAEPGEIWASSTLPGLVVGGPFAFSTRGRHELKGLPTPVELFVLD